jgi:hypothetical protein
MLALLTVAPARSAVAQQPPAAEPAQDPPIAAPTTTADRSGFLDEPYAIARGIEFSSRFLTSADSDEPKNGFYPELSNMITGAGWISAGPGYRHWLFGDRLLVDASAAISWRTYKMAQVRLEVPTLSRGRIVAGTQLRWQDLTQVTYFGPGPHSRPLDRSEYRLRSTELVGYTTLRLLRWLSINGSVGWVASPTLGPPTGPFKRGNPDTRQLFAEDPVYRFAEQPSYVHGEVSLVADTRDRRGYPTSGGVYRVSGGTYSDRGIDAFGFERYEGEAAHFVPLAKRRIVFALHGWLVASHTGEGQVVPLYLLPSLGGANTLRGYANYRFHDRNILVVNAESRIAVFTHVDVAVFADAGNVAPRVFDLNLDRRSYGIGLRVHSRGSTIARIDAARGGEGWQLLFRVNDPFRFSRISKRTATLPFVP